MTIWAGLWQNLFGSEIGWLGLNWGFWVGMIIVAIVVVLENAFFWSRKSFEKTEAGKKALERQQQEEEEM